MYDSGCQICCNWSRLKTGFKVIAHWSTMPQINMICTPPILVTLGQPALVYLYICSSLKYHTGFSVNFSVSDLSQPGFEPLNFCIWGRHYGHWGGIYLLDSHTSYNSIQYTMFIIQQDNILWKIPSLEEINEKHNKNPSLSFILRVRNKLVRIIKIIQCTDVDIYSLCIINWHWVHKRQKYLVFKLHMKVQIINNSLPTSTCIWMMIAIYFQVNMLTTITTHHNPPSLYKVAHYLCFLTYHSQNSHSIYSDQLQNQTINKLVKYTTKTYKYIENKQGDTRYIPKPLPSRPKNRIPCCLCKNP